MKYYVIPQRCMISKEFDTIYKVVFAHLVVDSLTFLFDGVIIKIR